MNKHQAERIHLGAQLSDAELKLAALQQELDRLAVEDPAYADTRWLRDAAQRACGQLRDAIGREERGRWNAVSRKVRELLHRDHPTLAATLIAEAERIVDGGQ